MNSLPSRQPFALRNNLLTLGALIGFVVLLFVFENSFDTFTMQIFKLCAINIILALSLNLINGFTGLFSLGHAAFMAVGAYTAAICTYFLKLPLFVGIDLRVREPRQELFDLLGQFKRIDSTALQRRVFSKRPEGSEGLRR